MPHTSPSWFRLTDDTRRRVGKHWRGKHTRLGLARLTLAERRLEAVVRVSASRYIRRRRVGVGDSNEDEEDEDEDSGA
jgi:hypothetical protein